MEPRNTEPHVHGEAQVLTSGLVHEMRHPLMGIKAGLQLVAQSAGRTVTTLEDWEMVVSQVARLEEIFDSYQELLTPRDMTPRPFPAGPVVQKAVELLRFRLKRLGPGFAVATEGRLPAAAGTPHALLHAVTNLLMNALDAVEGAEGARVEVRLLPLPGDPSRLQLRVADNGCGVPAEARERLFQPLFTTKGPERGTGLGLHTARRMVGVFGGDVRLLDEHAPSRRPWARTEFAVDLAPAEEEAA